MSSSNYEFGPLIQFNLFNSFLVLTVQAYNVKFKFLFKNVCKIFYFKLKTAAKDDI